MRKLSNKQVIALGMAATLVAGSISPLNVTNVSAASKNLKITKSMVKKGKFVVPKGTYQNITVDKNVNGANIVLKNVNVKKNIIVNGKGKRAITLNVKANTKVKKVIVNANAKIVDSASKGKISNVVVNKKVSLDLKASAGSVTIGKNSKGSKVNIAAKTDKVVNNAKDTKIVVADKGNVKKLISNGSNMNLSGDGKVANVKLNAKNQSVKLDLDKNKNIKIATTDKATASINNIAVEGKSEVKLNKDGIVEVTKVVNGKKETILYYKDGQKKDDVSETPTVSEAPAVSEEPAVSEAPVVSAAPSASTAPSAAPSASNATSQGGGSIISGSTNNSKPVKDLSYKGYTEKWSDEFNGTELDRTNWNVETHDPGWVNNELQAYVDTRENISVKDGKLILKAIKTKDENGKDIYTSGRLNTQGKQDFKYGIFEADVKVPEGQGFLPAFWMMPTDEGLYGQWPKCGEIDIMEVMGQDTKKAYGTIHYGAPHKENQGTKILKDSDYSKEFHKFSCKWEPGKITWYVDGYQFYETADWYSKVDGGNEVSYPAPFDQPFYMILNLAVGGSWVGYPDATTSFDKAELIVDSVKVYQKDGGYDENVKKPVKNVQLREPDANGNYINNGDFATAEDLADDKNWKFMTALGAEAEASVADGKMKIATTAAGTADYSVQLVQANVPMKKGATYKVSFDAYADESRTMKVDISAPDNGYARYFNDTTVELGKEKKTYTYDFTMTADDDANGRLEFNFGNAGSTATVYIDNVKVEKTGELSAEELNKKKVLPDGNCVYNGKFQEGEGRLGFWDISEGSKVYVTNILEETGKTGSDKYSVIRKLVATGNAVVSQKDLALQENTDYALSFKAGATKDSTIRVSVAGEKVKEVTIPASADGQMKEYTEEFRTTEAFKNKDFQIEIISEGEVYLDDVSVMENAMIKNGNFNADFAGFETFADGSAGASFSIDELNNNGNKTATVEITNSSDAEWKIQLKQTGVKLEKGKCYKLSFKAKSTLDRTIQYALQRDGSVHKNADGGEDWTPYTQDTVSVTRDYQTFEKKFKMTLDSDDGTIFNISMGGKNITDKHVISIDDIELVEISESEMPKVEAGENIIKNGNFDSDFTGFVTFADGSEGASFSIDEQDGNKAAKVEITNSADQEWKIQLKQTGVKLEKGKCYKLSFKAKSTLDRTIQYALQRDGSVHKNADGGEDWTPYTQETVSVTRDYQTFEKKFKMTLDSDNGTIFNISMGGKNITDKHVISIDDIELVEIPEIPESEMPKVEAGENLLKNADFSQGKDTSWNAFFCENGKGTISVSGSAIVYKIENVGNQNYSVQLKQEGIKLEKGKKYRITFKAKSTVARKIEFALQYTKGKTKEGKPNPYGGYKGKKESLDANSVKDIIYEFPMEEADLDEGKDSEIANFAVSMGQMFDYPEGEDPVEINTPASTITLSDFSIVEVTE